MCAVACGEEVLMPLDRPQVRDIVDANIAKMQRVLQLQPWQVEVTFVRLGENVRGECRLDIGHRKIAIGIDPDGLDDAAEVLFVVRHELLHAFDAEMELYRDAVRRLIPGDASDALDEVFVFAAERLVLCLERMLDHGLKIGVAEMCELGVVKDERNGLAQA